MSSNLYTRKGDGGTSKLYGDTTRRAKSDTMFEALGTVDELNALVGLCKTLVSAEERALLGHVQQRLFTLQAELAGAMPHILDAHVQELEEDIADIEAQIEVPRSFVIPGAVCESAIFDWLRTVARRAERTLVRAAIGGVHARAYMNRLSSLFYALARKAAEKQHVHEEIPTY